MQVVVNNLLTSYEKAGSGPVILLLHGWGDTKETYKRLAHDLGKSFTVIRPDLPGFGQTQPPETVWNLDDYAAFVHAFLAKLGVKKPYALIAHSNGGAVAIRGLAESTLQADKLVLIGSAGIRDREKIRRFLLKIIAKVGKVMTFWLPSRSKKVLQKALYGAAGSDMLVVPQLQETFKITVRQDVQKDAAKLKLPTLIIYGRKDTATPPLYGKIYQRLITGSQLRVLDDAEHFVHHDQPEELLAALKGFLK